VTPRPLIFISAVSKELRSARQLVANTLTFLGYQPIWQDIFGTESGDLCEMLREKIDQCKGVVQLVGRCYGAEPPAPDETFGRVSYTHYEALYARSRGKKVWYLFIDQNFPIDPHDPEREELRELQAAYRHRLQADAHIFHPLATSEALEAGVLKLRDDLGRLRRGVRQWAVGVVTLLFVVIVAVIWLVQAQRRQTVVMQKQSEQVSAIVDRYQKMEQALARLADVETQSKQLGPKLSPEDQRAVAYKILENDLGLPAGSLSKELPAFALELYNRADTTPLMRARAAYALGKFDEAEKLSLEGATKDRQAYETAQHVQEERRKSAIESYTLAGQSAQKRIQYAKAMEDFREAERLTDRARHPLEWARVQFGIASVLDDQGKHHDAEGVLREVLQERERRLGSKHPDTLLSRNLLANELLWQGKYVEAEEQYREILKLYEKMHAPTNRDTLRVHQNLAIALTWQGKYAEADAEFRRVNKTQEETLGPEDPDTLTTRLRFANNLCSQGKYVEAEAQYRDLLKINTKVRGPEHPETIHCRNNIAVTLALQGRYTEAEAQYREVLELEKKVFGPEHPYTLNCLHNIADVLASQGKYVEAESQAREALKLREKILGPEHPDTLNTCDALGRALAGQRKYVEAEREFRDTLKSNEKVLGPDHPQTLETCYDLAICLRGEGKQNDAVEFARRAAEGARKVLGPKHPNTQKYQTLLAELQGKP
jgi:tetratricopeptide (TPR) repeat protein